MARVSPRAGPPLGRAADPSERRASLFDPCETVNAGRVSLSQLSSDALKAMAPWLASALAPEWQIEDLIRALDSAFGVLISDAAGAPIGCAVVVLHSPEEGSASVPFLAIEPSGRFRGLGGEAALGLERHLRRRFRIRRFYAPVPDGRGLALYFWLRIGLRPLTASQSPGPVVGLTGEPIAGIWMMSEETEGGDEQSEPS
jgi:hypothetical protein